MLSRRAAAATLCIALTLLLSVSLVPLGATVGPAVPSPEPFVTPETPAGLAPTLNLQWVRDLPPLRPAWPDQPTLQFDIAYQPVVAGKTLFLSSSGADGVAAFDAETGDALWRFFTDGPVRFAPVVWDDKVYFTSDDGWLYCVTADAGNTRLEIPRRPVRPQTPRQRPPHLHLAGRGRRRSCRNPSPLPLSPMWGRGVGVRGRPSSISRPAFGRSWASSSTPSTPAPGPSTGPTTATAPFTSSSRTTSMPSPASRRRAGSRPSATGCWFPAADPFRRATTAIPASCSTSGWRTIPRSAAAPRSSPGRASSSTAAAPSISPRGPTWRPWAIRRSWWTMCFMHCTPTELRAYDVRPAGRPGWKPKPSAAVALPGVEALTARRVAPLRRRTRPRLRRRSSAAGRQTPHLLAGADRGPAGSSPGRRRPVVRVHARRTALLLRRGGRRLPDASDERIHGDPSGRRLARQGPRPARRHRRPRRLLRLLGRRLRPTRHGAAPPESVAMSSSSSRTPEGPTHFRSEMCDAGLYGERVAVTTADPDAVLLPPYLAELMVSEDLGPAGATVGRDFVSKAFASLRPYGGVACLPIADDDRATFAAAADGLANGRVRTVGEWTLLSREGPLPGAADWTHEHADAANTRVSRDRLVKAPLGLLWFGGPSHDGILPRHGHGPQPQVDRTAGCSSRAWTSSAPWTSTPAGCSGRRTCPASARPTTTPSTSPAPTPAAPTTSPLRTASMSPTAPSASGSIPPPAGKPPQFSMPPFPGEKAPPTWDWVTLGGDAPDRRRQSRLRRPHGKVAAVSASKRLAALDRATGRLLWTLTAQTVFRHNAVCVGGGRLYAIDRAVARPARTGSSAAAIRRRPSRASWPWTCAPARKSGPARPTRRFRLLAQLFGQIRYPGRGRAECPRHAVRRAEGDARLPRRTRQRALVPAELSAARP